MSIATKDSVSRATPLVGQKAHEIQAYGHVISMPIALAEDVRQTSVDNLNQVLADTIMLRDLYKKHHWQVSGPTFYQLALAVRQALRRAERTGRPDRRADHDAGRREPWPWASDVAEMTLVPRPPKGREEAPMQISRLLHAHEIVLLEARSMARIRRPRPATTAPTTCW